MLLFGIVGNPVGHSKSPLIHNTWLKEHHIPANYQFIPVENQENLEEILTILPKMGYKGINVTVPYKNLAYQICKKHNFTISEIAEDLEAINTINFTEKYATNTDSYGFSKTFNPKDEDHVLIIGAGGVTPAIVYACNHANITLTNRTTSKAQELSEKFMCDLYTGDLSKLDLSNFDVIINTTSVGINNESIPLKYSTLQKHTTCIDVIYNPKMTKFLQESQKKGCKIQNGTMMLIHQGAKAFETWNKIYPNIDSAKKNMKEFIL